MLLTLSALRNNVCRNVSGHSPEFAVRIWWMQQQIFWVRHVHNSVKMSRTFCGIWVAHVGGRTWWWFHCGYSPEILLGCWHEKFQNAWSRKQQQHIRLRVCGPIWVRWSWCSGPLGERSVLFNCWKLFARVCWLMHQNTKDLALSDGNYSNSVRKHAPL